MTLADVLTIAYFVIALLPAIVLHELSHGVTADRMGDPTPRMAGRLTLNPARHIDPFGTVILPGLLLVLRVFARSNVPVFGYAKPMPINPANLRSPDQQTMWIAVVGPLTNFVLAVAGALALRFVDGGAGELGRFLVIWVFVNVLLAVFNLFPIPPLDGSKVVARFLPWRARQFYKSMEPYGAIFMLVIFFLFPGVIFSLIQPAVEGLFRLLVS